MGDVVGPSSVQVGRGKEERLGLANVMWPSSVRGRGKGRGVGGWASLCGQFSTGEEGKGVKLGIW